MVAHGLQFPQFASVDEIGIWRFHANKRSLSAVKGSPYCAKLVKVFKIVDQMMEEVVDV